MSDLSIGIEITSTQVKLVEMDAAAVPPKVLRFSAANLLSSDPEDVAQQVQAELAYLNPKAKNARIVISHATDAFLYTLLSLPAMPENEMRVVVERELRSVATLPTQEMLFDYQILGDAGGNKKSILAAAGSAGLIEERARYLQQFKLTPEVVTTTPLALFSAIHLMDGVDRGIVIHIHLGDAKIHILILRDGKWAFHREFLRSQTSKEEAATEIHRTFLYFLQKFKGEEIRRVFLTGSGHEEIGGEWEEALGVKVERFVPRLDMSAMKGVEREFQQVLPEFVIPIGLAGTKARDAINLLRGRKGPEPSWTSRGMFQGRVPAAVIGGILLSALILAGLYGWIWQANANATKLIAEKKEELKKWEPTLSAQKDRDFFWGQYALFKNLHNHTVWGEFLRELSNITPGEMSLQSLGFKREGDRVRFAMKGDVVAAQISTAQEIFNAFYNRLGTSPFLAQVAVDPLSIKVGQEKEQAKGSGKAEKAGREETERLSRLDFEIRGELKTIEIEY